MPRRTLIVIFTLAIIATLLLGINIGKRLGISHILSQKSPAPTIPVPSLSPSLTPLPVFTTPVTQSDSRELTYDQDMTLDQGSSAYTDEACGFTVIFPGGYINQNTQNGRSTIITDPDNPDQAIITACQAEIPKPPLPPEKIENIILDGIPARLYHDTSSQDGSPRDEVIVTHPTNFQEIIIAGYGPAFNQAVSSFRFLR